MNFPVCEEELKEYSLFGKIESERRISDLSSSAKVLRRTLELDLPKTDGICFEEYLSEINEEIK